jgi:hypothetical protein
MTVLAVATLPQHLMNVAQAVLAGHVSRDVHFLVVDPGDEGGASSAQILAGTISYVARILPGSTFRHKQLWRRGAGLQNALDVRFLGRGPWRCPSLGGFVRIVGLAIIPPGELSECGDLESLHSPQ